MYQQNYLQQLSKNTIIDAPTKQYPKRQFNIEGLLGIGSQSVAYLANPIQWGIFQNKVALKFEGFMKDDVKQLYQKVIEHQNKFETINNQNDNSSNFIRIYDCFDYLESVVTVMEVGQINLNEYLKKHYNIIQPLQKQSICIQILQSITFLHSLNLIHRDIQLDHYQMIGPSVKLIDFGLTKKETFHSNYSTDILYKYPLQPPEFFQSKQSYTTSVDVYTLGCIFYEVMKGTQLFKSNDNTELQQLKQNQNFIENKIEELNISDEWKQTMKRMLNPQSNLRISIQEAMEILSKKSNPIIIQKFQQTNFATLPSMANNQKISFPQTQPQIKLFNQDTQQIQILQSQTLQSQTLQSQTSIFIQINSMIQNLDQPYNMEQLLQSKQQSIKLLISLKEQILMKQQQLENNTTSVQPINNFDTNQENQQKQKKELSPIVQQKLDVIKKRCQELEEKCISIQEEEDLNQNLQKINEELELLQNITQDVDNRQKNYQYMQQQVDQLKEKQKLILKQKMVEEELSYLQNQNQPKINIIQLQKEVETNQSKIFKLQQSDNTIKYLQDQKIEQQQKIDDLNQQISTKENLENELKLQKDQLLELKVKQKYLDIQNSEIQKNENMIQLLKNEIQKLQKNQIILEEQQKQIQDHRNQIKELQDMEVGINNNKEYIFKMKSQLRQQSHLSIQPEQQSTEIINPEKEVKQLEETQNRMDQFNQQGQYSQKQNYTKYNYQRAYNTREQIQNK